MHRYQSTVLGSYQTIELIETFVNYAESIKRCVCIVYDPQTSARGTLTLKAITLKDNFIKVQPPSHAKSPASCTLRLAQHAMAHEECCTASCLMPRRGIRSASFRSL